MADSFLGRIRGLIGTSRLLRFVLHLLLPKSGSLLLLNLEISGVSFHMVLDQLLSRVQSHVGVGHIYIVLTFLKNEFATHSVSSG